MERHHSISPSSVQASSAWPSPRSCRGISRESCCWKRMKATGRKRAAATAKSSMPGIYYPEGSLKASLCVEGRKLLYEACEKREIPHRRIGKLIVATNPDEEEALLALQGKAEKNGVDDLLFLSGRVVHSLEPDVFASAGLLSPSTGIIDSHSLMRCPAGRVQRITASPPSSGPAVTAAQFDGNRYDLEINDGEYRVSSRVVVNSAGLQSDRVAAMAGIDLDARAVSPEALQGKLLFGLALAGAPAPRLPRADTEARGSRRARHDRPGRPRPFRPRRGIRGRHRLPCRRGKTRCFPRIDPDVPSPPREGVAQPGHVRHPAQAPGPGRGHSGFRHPGGEPPGTAPAGSISSGSSRRGSRPALPSRGMWRLSSGRQWNPPDEFVARNSLPCPRRLRRRILLADGPLGPGDRVDLGTCLCPEVAETLRPDRRPVRSRRAAYAPDPHRPCGQYRCPEKRGCLSGRSLGNHDRPPGNARSFFPYGRRLFWWDSLDQTYFAGYALWNYLVFPALLLRQDIRWEETGPNRLLARFPENIPTHSPVQEFLFDPVSGLLRQHNYTAEVMGGWAKAANAVIAHGTWNGIPYPSHRRVTPRKKDGSPAGGPVLIDLVIHDWSVSS